MFATLDPNYVPVDLYKFEILDHTEFKKLPGQAYAKRVVRECWGDMTRTEWREMCATYRESIRELSKDRKTRAEAEADEAKFIERHPELKGKTRVYEFNYL